MGDEDFTVRQEAEATLKAAGPAAMPLIEGLRDSPEPEVVIRARRVRDWILLGLDDGVPEKLAVELGEFEMILVLRVEVILKSEALLEKFKVIQGSLFQTPCFKNLALPFEFLQALIEFFFNGNKRVILCIFYRFNRIFAADYDFSI